jgi:hypothetical protein
MSIKITPLDDVRKRGYQILSKELGAFDFIRFIQQSSSGYGDYTKDKSKILSEISIDEIYNKIKKKG